MRTKLLLLVLASSACVLAPIAVGCSGDDDNNNTTPAGDGGAEATTDATTDSPAARQPGDSRYLATVPVPNYPESAVILGRTVYTTTPSVFTNTGDTTGPSKVFGFNIDTGAKTFDYTITGEDVTKGHSSVGAAADSKGRLYVLNTQLGVVRVDPATSTQSIYAAIPDIPPCGAAGGDAGADAAIDGGGDAGATTTDCSLGTPGSSFNGATDLPPLPNDIVFDDAGNAYVSDSLQGVIFKIPPGGTAHVWLADPSWTPAAFAGPNGLALSPDKKTLYMILSVDASFKASLLAIPFVASPKTSDVTKVVDFGDSLAQFPDDLAVAASGNLYVTLAGVPGVGVYSPDGKQQIALYKGPIQGGTNGAVTTPYENPAGIGFDNTTSSIIVANHSIIDAIVKDMVMFSVAVPEPGAPLVRPDLP